MGGYPVLGREAYVLFCVFFPSFLVVVLADKMASLLIFPPWSFAAMVAATPAIYGGWVAYNGINNPVSVESCGNGLTELETPLPDGVAMMLYDGPCASLGCRWGSWPCPNLDPIVSGWFGTSQTGRVLVYSTVPNVNVPLKVYKGHRLFSNIGSSTRASARCVCVCVCVCVFACMLSCVCCPIA